MEGVQELKVRATGIPCRLCCFADIETTQPFPSSPTARRTRLKLKVPLLLARRRAWPAQPSDVVVLRRKVRSSSSNNRTSSFELYSQCHLCIALYFVLISGLRALAQSLPFATAANPSGLAQSALRMHIHGLVLKDYQHLSRDVPPS